MSESSAITPAATSPSMAAFAVGYQLGELPNDSDRQTELGCAGRCCLECCPNLFGADGSDSVVGVEAPVGVEGSVSGEGYRERFRTRHRLEGNFVVE